MRASDSLRSRRMPSVFSLFLQFCDCCAQCIGAVGALPCGLKILSAHMAVCRELAVLRLAQLQRFDDAERTQVKALSDGICQHLLVCLAVWVAMGADTVGAKAVAVFGPVMLFVLCGFEHSVANMYFIPTGLFLGAAGSMGSFLLNNLLPVTIGNILGGACIVGCGVWALYHKKGNK